MANNLIKYGFSLGRVHVLEQTLLNQNHYERLLEAKNYEEKVHILSETIFAPFVEQAIDEEGIEQSMAGYSDSFYQLIDELIEDKAVRAYFRQKPGNDKESQKKYFSKRLDLAKQSGIPLLIKIARLEVDKANIKIWLRLKSRDVDAYFPGGSIPIPALAQYVQETAPLLDKDLDECILFTLRQYYYEPDTANRIIVFLKAKELEIKNVRHILFGGINNFSREQTEPNLRYLYA